MPEIKYLTQEETQRFFSKIHNRRDRALFKLMYDFVLGLRRWVNSPSRALI